MEAYASQFRTFVHAQMQPLSEKLETLMAQERSLLATDEAQEAARTAEMEALTSKVSCLRL